MATLSAVIVPAKVLKGGRHKVRISVAHNGETRYIVTDLIIDSGKEFKNGNIVKRPDAAFLNTKLRGILQRYQCEIDELEYVYGLTCAELVYHLKNAGNNKHRTLLSIYNEYIENLRVKESSRNNYIKIWKVLSKHINNKMLVNSITLGTIIGFDKALRDRGISSTTAHNYLVFLRILLNYAKKCGYVQFRVDPFANFKLPNVEVRQSWLTVDEIKKIRNIELKRKCVKKCRDLFMLSYYLGGINMIDLLKINFNEQTEVIHYVRTKTENSTKLNKYVEFGIPDEAKTIINRYKGDNGYIIVTPFERKTNCTFFFHLYMPKLAEATGIKHIIYYSARKSFSQHAFDIGVSTSVIDYILGHKVDKGGTSLYSYIYVTPDMATKAIRQVLDNLK